MNKYTVNQLVFVVCLAVFLLNLASILILPLSFSVHFLISLICLHYFANLTHISSHNLASRNKKINYLIGWFSSLFMLVFTFIDFRVTHFEHHRHTSDPDRDPDNRIVKTGSILFLPFRMIWYKDTFFIKYCFSKKNYKLILDYIFQRFLQLSIFIVIIYFYSYELGLLYILPLVLIGLANAMFLYFYPHYSNSTERIARAISTSSKANIFKLPSRFLVFLINYCRIVHHKHHLKVLNNQYYYPLWWKINKSINIVDTAPEVKR